MTTLSDKNQCLSQSRNCGVAPYHKDGEDWDGKTCILLRTVKFQLKDGRFFQSPVGRITDLGSVPDLAKSFVDDNDESLPGFIGHDELCCAGSIISNQENGRKIADDFLYDVARQKKQSWWRAAKTWIGVKIGDIGIDYFVNPPVRDLAYIIEYCKRMQEDILREQHN